jgi:hypothetical protein
MTKELKITPIAELTTVKQKSAAARKSNGTLQTRKSNYFYCCTVHFDDSITFIHQLMDYIVHKLVYKSDGKSNVSVRPQKLTVKRETFKEMAGDRNRPLGLLLERIMILIVMMAV